VVEESPSPFITPEMRATMGAVAVKAARAVNYTGAGTIEFLADADRNFYFLEMNTRIQVEHPVTELVSGVDLVKAQIRVAAGEPLPFAQAELAQRGWAIECRVYAEDPAAGFVPSPGKIETMRLPDGPGVRVDAGVYAGAEVPIFYDPMIAKLAVWGHDRAEAIARMSRALKEFIIAGELTTNLEFHRWIMSHPKFMAGDFDTSFIGQEYHPEAMANGTEATRIAAILSAAVAVRRDGANTATVSAPGRSTGSPWKTLGRLDVLRR
jgi:acetyl-CoA carboxylase, biotin carboxylase subunit